MSKKALITAALVVVTSSAAFADPIVRDHRTIRPVVAHAGIRIDARAAADLRVRPVVAPPIAAPVIRPMPVVYAPVTLANNLTLAGRATITLNASMRTFRKLELRADNGRTAIDKVIVLFGNGTKETLDLDAKLSKKSPTLTVDLPGGERHIERIIVVGATHGRGAALDVIGL